MRKSKRSARREHFGRQNTLPHTARRSNREGAKEIRHAAGAPSKSPMTEIVHQSGAALCRALLSLVANGREIDYP
jgi:hypothetical protein